MNTDYHKTEQIATAPTREDLERWAKFEDAAMAEGFTKMPNTIIRNPKLSHGAFRLYNVLLSYAWQDGFCFPGQKRLAEEMGIGLRMVYQYTKELEAAKLIHVRHRPLHKGVNKTNVYTFTAPSETGPDQQDAANPDRQDAADNEDAPGNDPLEVGTSFQSVPTCGKPPNPDFHDYFPRELEDLKSDLEHLPDLVSSLEEFKRCADEMGFYFMSTHENVTDYERRSVFAAVGAAKKRIEEREPDATSSFPSLPDSEQNHGSDEAVEDLSLVGATQKPESRTLDLFDDIDAVGVEDFPDLDNLIESF